MRILITGGAGFVGVGLALALRRDYPNWEIVAFDNLKRRGSELNLSALRQAGIEFFHGDIRIESDLFDIPGTAFDLVIEASAEPSVRAGLDSSPSYVLSTNLLGTINALEFLRKRAGGMIFLSTSRVYSMVPLRDIALISTDSRLEISPLQNQRGVTVHGISEEFTTLLPRSLYGATKLASELLIQEYADTYKVRAVINRCGVIAGPGQFGKSDQGVFTLWVASHYFGRTLRYTGFGGTGKQVRDLLHPADLYSIIMQQVANVDNWNADVFNVGGGLPVSVSLYELTELCKEIVGREIAISSDVRTSPVDIPLYISDCRKVEGVYAWRPERTVRDIVTDITEWLSENEERLRPLFAV